MTHSAIALNSLLGEDGYFVVSELQDVVSPEPVGTTRIGMRTGHRHTSIARYLFVLAVDLTREGTGIELPGVGGPT